MIEFNLNSLDHLSCLLFGGQLTDFEIEPMFDENNNPVLIKSGPNKGQIKTHKVQTTKHIKGLLDGLGTKYSHELSKKGFYSTDGGVLSKITSQRTSTLAATICKTILDTRSLAKQISTYYQATEELTYDVDQSVHPQFNHTATDTGRLSSKSPNVQNQPSGEVLQHFKSHYLQSNLFSVDLSQIEIIVFAHLCKDKTLTRLLQEGLDVHRYLASITLGIPEHEITDEQRKRTKAVTFGIIYGNGAFTLSETLNVTKEIAQDYITAFYETFPGAKTWHTRIQAEVLRNGMLKTFTGRLLKFKKYPAKFEWQIKKGIIESYNPPDIKNYPVQSLAGDIYKLLLVHIYRDYLSKSHEFRENIKIINTIHDSIMFDCNKGWEEELLGLIRSTLDNAACLVYNQYNETINLPIKYTLESGPTWFDLTPLTLTKEINDDISNIY